MYQGTMQTTMRYFFGETCEKVIQMLPEEKQNKSTIKYTVYLFAFAITNLSAALGPGKDMLLGLLQTATCHSCRLTIEVCISILVQR